MEKKYMVAAGKSISSRAGIIGEFQPISIKQLGSPAIFEALIKAGCIVDNAPAPERRMTVDLRKPPKPVTRGVL